MVRLGSALFNADHGHLAAEVARVEAAGLDFVHIDVFDGHMVPDLGFSPLTMHTLRSLTRLPFEVHLAANDPLRFIPALVKGGANLVFLPLETTPLVYEAVFAVREQGLRVGLCLALGTSLSLLEPVLPLLDAVLLLGRVTGEGARGRTFNDLLLPRIQAVRHMIDRGGYDVDLQAAGGLERESSRAAVAAGAMALPIGAALHREADMTAYVSDLRAYCSGDAAALNNSRGDGSVKTGSAPVAPDTYRVLIASRSFGPHCPEALERMRVAGCLLIPNDLGRAPTEAELLARIADVDVLISGTEPVTAAVLAAAPRLKVISKHGVGYENIDLDAARARGIPVAVAGGAIADSVADMAMALLLAVARQIPHGDALVRQGLWKRLVGVELREKTLGIVGLGQIGKELCRRATGFGLRVVAYDLFQDERFAREWNVRYVSLDKLLTSADFVSLHAPATGDTRHLINQETLARMKPSAFLINTARGDLVDEVALASALREGRLAGAALDVFAQEPPSPDNPLLSLENVVLATHSAGQTDDGLRRMGEMTAENALRVLRGEAPLYSVTSHERAGAEGARA